MGKQKPLGDLGKIFDETPEMEVDIPPPPRYDDIDIAELDEGLDLRGLI